MYRFYMLIVSVVFILILSDRAQPAYNQTAAITRGRNLRN